MTNNLLDVSKIELHLADPPPCLRPVHHSVSHSRQFFKENLINNFFPNILSLVVKGYGSVLGNVLHHSSFKLK